MPGPLSSGPGPQPAGGSSGYSGISGFSGRSGFSGANPGASGYSGYSGKSGYSGFSGIGTSGYSGYSGKSGYSGYSSAGTSGYSGFSGVGGISNSAGDNVVPITTDGSGNLAASETRQVGAFTVQGLVSTVFDITDLLSSEATKYLDEDSADIVIRVKDSGGNPFIAVIHLEPDSNVYFDENDAPLTDDDGNLLTVTGNDEIADRLRQSSTVLSIGDLSDGEFLLRSGSGITSAAALLAAGSNADLPTSDPEVAGALWSNLGAVQVSAG